MANTNKIITIGREFGSGGRELGRKLAEKLGYEFYDKEIVAEIAKRTDFSENYVQNVLENSPHELFPITVAHSFTYVDTYSLVQKQNIFAQQEKVIKELAEKSNCVIVGRCADYILASYNPVKIFVYSSIESKMQRCKDRGEDIATLNDKKLRRKIKNIDKNRSRYYNFYTGKKWGDKLEYDYCINTTNADFEKLATHLAELVK